MTRTMIAAGRVQAPDFPAGLSRPALRALATAGFMRLDELASVPAARVKRLHGMGPKGVRILREALAERGRSFTDETPSPVLPT